MSANIFASCRRGFMNYHLTKSLLVSGLVLSIGSSCAAQQTANTDLESTDVRARSLLVQVLDQTKAMDECALRTLLRLRVSTYLWSSQSEEDAKEAERVAMQAVADLDENKGSMPAGMATWMRSQLVAEIELHAPALAERLRKQDASDHEATRNQFDSAYSMLKNSNEVKPSVEAMRRALNSGSDPGMILLFFLGQLEQKQPTEIPGLLESIISVQEQKPDTFSLQTLTFLRDFCIREANPPQLQTRFLTAAFNAVLTASTSPDRTQLTQAYELLTSLLPAMQRLSPSLYAMAVPQAAAMARLDSQQLDLVEIHRRVEQSSDPVSQLITEANDAKNKAIRNDLLVEAAQRALGDGRLRLAIDVVADIDFKEEQKGEQRWRDQFLLDVIKSAIGKKDMDTAKYGTGKIKSPLERASALQEMARYFFESRDLSNATQILNDALKLILDSETSPAKALSLLNIVSEFTKVDDSRVVEVTQLAIKAINRIPTPDRSDKPGSNSHNEYVKSLVAVASTLIPLFESLARKDEQRALSLTGEIERREVSAPALFGTSIGIIRSMKETKNSMIKK
jgi:hypothetical protein